jgi:hypothetical protein
VLTPPLTIGLRNVDRSVTAVQASPLYALGSLRMTVDGSGNTVLSVGQSDVLLVTVVLVVIFSTVIVVVLVIITPRLLRVGKRSLRKGDARVKVVKRDSQVMSMSEIEAEAVSLDLYETMLK